MTDLRFENPETTAAFDAELRKLNVRLPLQLSKEDSASLVDADGNDILTVDVNRDRTDVEAALIAMTIMVAVNTCGGFQATLDNISEG